VKQIKSPFKVMWSNEPSPDQSFREEVLATSTRSQFSSWGKKQADRKLLSKVAEHKLQETCEPWGR